MPCRPHECHSLSSGNKSVAHLDSAQFLIFAIEAAVAAVLQNKHQKCRNRAGRVALLACPGERSVSVAARRDGPNSTATEATILGCWSCQCWKGGKDAVVEVTASSALGGFLLRTKWFCVVEGEEVRNSSTTTATTTSPTLPAFLHRIWEMPFFASAAQSYQNDHIFGFESEMCCFAAFHEYSSFLCDNFSPHSAFFSLPFESCWLTAERIAVLSSSKSRQLREMGRKGGVLPPIVPPHRDLRHF